ncbi:MAG: PASTA domain-containing protein, partial [bacterium]|nr:PASTA domain-containing protein [bacterium]
STIRGTASLYVGSRAGGSHFFEGTVSELRLWRRARTAEEIGAAMASRLSGDEVDLAGYWPLDEIAVRDALVRPAGTLTAATWADAPELPLLDADVAAEARTAPALEFDGTRSAVTVPASASLTPAAALTVEAWVRPAVTGTRAFLAPVVSLCDAAGGWELRAADAEYGFLLTVAGTQHVVTAAPAGDGERWTHLAATFDGSRLQLHVNGVALPAAGRDAAGEVSPCSRPLSLGRSSWWPERRFTGELAEVRVWNVARTAAEIQAHLFARLGGDEAGLVGYWQASEGEGETVGHASDAALDGIAENVRWVASDLPPRVAPGEVVETDLAWQIENLESRVAARTEELRKAIQEQQYRTARKAELATQLAEGDALWEEERADLQATLEGEIADRKAQLEALDAAQREADLEVVDALLDDVVEDAHTRIGQARTVLGQRDGHFGLNRVGMNLRYVAGAGGRGALFPARDAAVDAKRIAGLRLDFTPGKTAAPAAVAQRRVPRVVGYTEAVAQRKLKQAGYLPEVHAQAVSPGDRVGRVVSQFPAADTEAPARTAVRVFLGKAG